MSDTNAEHFVYAPVNRPAGYGTVPVGYLWVSNIGGYDYGTVTYAWKLTPEEMYRYELYPVSHNAYQHAIGSRVLVNGQDEATVMAHEPRHRYTVEYDTNGELDSIYY